MDIKAQLEGIRQRIAGLSASQKMLVFALAAIMGMTLFYTARYAGDPEMSPVLDQPFSNDDVSKVTAQLASKGIRYTVTGNKVFVPTDRKFEVLADLSYAEMLPSNTQVGFDDLLSKITPWMPQTQVDQVYLQAKQVMLANIIQRFPNVRSAVVMIDPTRRNGFGDNLIQPTATVTITTRDGSPAGKKLVYAAANVVVGAQAGLARGRVNVIVDGASYPVRDADDDSIAGGTDRLDLKQRTEQVYVQKITAALYTIPNVMASVTVDVDNARKTEVKTTVDPKNVIQKETMTDINAEENPGGAGAAEAGVGSNIGASIATGGGGGAGSTRTNEKTSFTVDYGKSTVTTQTPAGKETVLSAAVIVPRSYVVNSLKLRSNGAEPADAAVEQEFAVLKPRIAGIVKNCTAMQNTDAISVEMFAEATPVMLASAAPSSMSSVPTALIGHTKEIILGALAVMSLFMMSMIVRKTAPAPVLAAASAEDTGPKVAQALSAIEDAVGIVGSGAETLDGVELGDDEVKAQQVLDQVRNMVKDDPDAAANLMKRWLNR